MSGWSGWNDWNPGPMVSFTFDDSIDTDYTQVFPQFQSRGVAGTSYVVTSWLLGGGHLTPLQMATMQAAGWEFGPHSHSHVDLTGIDDATLTKEIRDCQHYLRSCGMTAHNMAYPMGFNNAAVRAKTALYLRSGRGTVAGVDRRPISDLYALKVRDLSDPALLATYQAQVDAAKASRSWLQFLTHSADAPLATALGQMIDYVQAAGIPILTVDRALDRLGVASGPANPETGNVLLSTEDFTSSYWTTANLNRTADQIAAPVGTGLADLLEPTTATADLYQKVLLKQNTTYTFSIYLRTVSGAAFFAMSAWDDVFGHQLGFANKNISTTWTRFTLTFDSAAWRPWSAIRLGGYASSWSSGENVYAAGAMLNEGAEALPYVPGIA